MHWDFFIGCIVIAFITFLIVLYKYTQAPLKERNKKIFLYAFFWVGAAFSLGLFEVLGFMIYAGASLISFYISVPIEKYGLKDSIKSFVKHIKKYYYIYIIIIVALITIRLINIPYWSILSIGLVALICYYQLHHEKELEEQRKKITKELTEKLKEKEEA